MKFKLRPEDRPDLSPVEPPEADRPGSQLRPGLAPDTRAVGGGEAARPGQTTEGTYQCKTLTNNQRVPSGPTPKEVENYVTWFKEKFGVSPTSSEVALYVQFYPEWHNKFPK